MPGGGVRVRGVGVDAGVGGGVAEGVVVCGSGVRGAGGGMFWWVLGDATPIAGCVFVLVS